MEEAACSSCSTEVTTDQPAAEAFGAAPVHQGALTSAEADAVVMDTFSLQEFRIFFHALTISDNDRYSAIIAVLNQRETQWAMVSESSCSAAAEWAMVSESSCSAAAATAADDDKEKEQVLTPEELRNKAKEDANAKVIEALASIDTAEEACGGLFADEFKLAREKLQACTDPLAAGAAAAQNIIRTILMKCPWKKAEKVVKKADRDTRDVVVLRCRALCKHPKDRNGFLQLAAQAYGRELDKEVRAQLLLAYHKDWGCNSSP